jgi:hypothetical protein
MGYGSRAAFNRIMLTIVTVVALTIIGILILCLLYAVIRFYIFGKLLAKEKSARAIVKGKRYQILGAPADDNSGRVPYWGMLFTGGFSLVTFYWLLSSIPLVAMLRNGLDEPYLVRFDLADGKKVELHVTDSVYMQLHEGHEGLLTYKGKHLVRFKSHPI